jgi:hypothetical protein
MRPTHCSRQHPSAAATHPPRARRVMATAGLLVLMITVGCQSTRKPDFNPTWPRFFLESTDGRGMPVMLPESEVRMVLNGQPVLTEADVINVEIAQVELGRCLAFQLSPGAARDCYRLTASHQGRRLVLLINGAPFGARRIDRPIADGLLLMFVEVPDSALPSLVADMNRSIVVLQRELARR